MTTLYGIKNCDTMKKAFKWLDGHGVLYDFHDYKKSGADEGVLKSAIKAYGWENVLNRRGTTWRQLSDDTKNNMDGVLALKTAQDNPSIIKRPLLIHRDKTYIGFSPEKYSKIFEKM